ncbi:hypothetical protein niasHS_001709 [Heterodera schachtii]|uniref:DNA polymerase epsilon subunit n=1 Tax=Heterodera schachtii TaxID=97005 RepID=A0ABD2KBZ8_HETSC
MSSTTTPAAATANQNVLELRRMIKKFFAARSLYLSEQALTYLADQLNSFGRAQCQTVMARVVQLVERKGVVSDLLDLDCLKTILHEVNRQKRNESETLFKLESVVEWRRTIVEDKRRIARKLAHNTNNSSNSTNNSPWDKLSFDAYRQRFELIRALIEKRTTVAAATAGQQFDPIDALLARRGTNVRILAQLFRGTDGDFVAEDLSGSVRLHLGTCTYDDGLYFEGGTFVFEGLCSPSGDRLDVERMALPPMTTLESTESVDGAPGLATRTQEMARRTRGDPNDRIVLMSDVHLDNERVLKALYHLLQGFSASPPNIFIFCGPFLGIQRAHSYMEQAANAFRHFANILSEFSHAYHATEFIFVPSADDAPPLQIFPRPTLLPVVQKCFKEAKNVHFATNPCKLVFKDRHIVIFRDDVVEKVCRSAVFMPKNAKASRIPKLFCDTIWAQRHFSPLPLFINPIQPHFDPLFQLFPSPDALVIADRFKAFFEPADERRRLTMNPGPFSLGTHFEFQVYYPTLQRVEHSAYHEENA